MRTLAVSHVTYGVPALVFWCLHKIFYPILPPPPFLSSILTHFAKIFPPKKATDLYYFEKSEDFGVAKATFIRKKNKKSGDIWSLMQTKFAKKGRRWYL